MPSKTTTGLLATLAVAAAASTAHAATATTPAPTTPTTPTTTTPVASTTPLTTTVAAKAPATTSDVQLLKLDLANPANQDPGGVAVQSTPLRSKVAYLVSVVGTGSLWAPSVGPATCGLPERMPVLQPSPGQATGSAETDAALLFAAPKSVWLGDQGDACDTTYKAAVPPFAAGFKFGGAAGLKPAVPIDGVPKKPNALHLYTYLAVGDGTPLRFQYEDMYTADNSGIFTIVIGPAPACRKSGPKKLRTPKCVVPAGLTKAVAVP